MSDTATPPAASKSPAEKKNRNPVERAVVWGAILLLLVLVVIEGSSRFAYTASLNRLQARLELDNAGESLHIDEVPPLLAGFPTSSEADGQVSYKWSSLLKSYGIHVKYDAEKVVTGLETDNPPEEEVFDPSSIPPNQTPEHGEADAMPNAAGGDGGPAAEGNGGGEGGRRNFDPMQFDADGDGQISKDEAPERMQERFAEIDADGNGFLTAEEFAASRQRRGDRPQRPDGEGSGNGEGNRPERPDGAGETTPNETPEPGSTTPEPATETPTTETPATEPAPQESEAAPAESTEANAE